MIVRIRRLFKNLASIRDYQFAKAKEKHESLTIILEPTNERMTIPLSELDNRVFSITSKIPHKSRYNPFHSYTLVDFVWHPDEKTMAHN